MKNEKETKPSLDHIIKLSKILLTSNVYIHNQENNDNAMGVNIYLNEEGLQKNLEPIYLHIQQNQELIEL